MVDYQSFREYTNAPFIIVLDQDTRTGIGVSYATRHQGKYIRLHKYTLDFSSGSLVKTAKKGDRGEAFIVQELQALSSGTMRSLIDRQLLGVERTMKISTYIINEDLIKVFLPLQTNHTIDIKVWQSNGVFGMFHHLKVVVPLGDENADIAAYIFLPYFLQALVRCEPFEPQGNRLLHNWQIDYKAEKLSE